MRHLLFCLLLLIVPDPLYADLKNYIQKPEPKARWELKKKQELDSGTIYSIHFISQEWQTITWEHELVVYYPKKVKPHATMFLWVTGGKPSMGSTVQAYDLALKMHAPVAFLFDIPNQPLLDGKKEDTLIAETFTRYLKSKDEDWPLLFPMVKSVIKAMDILQEFSKKEWQTELAHFVIAGASKRGWTSWLTGSTGDPRVRAIAPMVIDTLNMMKQMPHQIESYGAPSQAIEDYLKRELVPIPDTPEAKKLWRMVDPWSYRSKLLMPKLIVNGTNDPYWTQDALNLYWEDLAGDKWLLYVPNAGHGLDQKEQNRKHRTRAVNTVAVFARMQIEGTRLPVLKWSHEGTTHCTLKVQSQPAPKAARIWSTTAPTRDFRKATWKDQSLDIKEGRISYECEPPADGFRVFFAECEYELDGLPYYLSTQLRIIGASKNK